MRLHDILESQLDEVSMSPGALKDYANTPFAQAMTAGFEAELVIPNVQSSEEDDYDSEPDYDMDERVSDNNDIFNFFVGEYNSRRAVERAVEKIDEEFFEYADERIYDEFENDVQDLVRDVLKDEDPDLSDEELDEILDDVESAKYIKAKDTAYEKYREDADYDQYVEKFFRNNYPYMSDIANAFDLYWPYMTSTRVGGPGENDINDVADAISVAIGMDVKGSSGYHSAKRGTNYFILEPDSSIDAEESEGEGGLELVSPPMPLNDCLEYLDKVFKWAKDYGCTTNRSTGFHMGISIPGQTMDNVDHLKFTLFLGDEYVLRQFGRESNTYAKSMIKKMRSQIQFQQDREGGENSVEQMLEVFKSGMNTTAANIMKKMMKTVSDRYVTVNIKANYIEVRSAGGDYLDDLDKIKLTLLRYVRAMGIAADPEAEKNEYAKKLYKFLNPLIKGEEDVIKYFSQYSAGMMPKKGLIGLLRQAQEKRAGKGKNEPKWSSELKPGQYQVKYRVAAIGDRQSSTLIKAFSQQDAVDRMEKTFEKDENGRSNIVIDRVDFVVEVPVTSISGTPPQSAATTSAQSDTNGSNVDRFINDTNMQQGIGNYTFHYETSFGADESMRIAANNRTEAYQRWFEMVGPMARYIGVEFEPAVPGSTVHRAAQRAAAPQANQSRTYLITYLPPNGGEQQIEIDANSPDEASQEFKSTHPASYVIYSIQAL